MNESQISVRYAKALYLSASGKNEQDRVYEDMRLLEETCTLADFKYLLKIPTVQPSRKCSLVGNILEQHISELSMSLIDLVIKNKRETYLPMIALNFREIYRKEKGIRSATLVTAREVEQKAMKRIEELIAKTYKSDVELKVSVDNEVIGGFVLTVEGLQYDASVATGLRKMKKQLLQTSIEK